jgi:hypothetical protein
MENGIATLPLRRVLNNPMHLQMSAMFGALFRPATPARRLDHCTGGHFRLADIQWISARRCDRSEHGFCICALIDDS